MPDPDVVIGSVPRPGGEGQVRDELLTHVKRDVKRDRMREKLIALMMILGSLAALFAIEWIMVDAILDFQRLRHGRYLTLPKEFSDCLYLVNVEGWSSPTLHSPIRALVSAPCGLSFDVHR